MRPIFITATGTDVGKTYVTCALIRAFKRMGVEIAAYKPIISGFDAEVAAASDTGRILAALGRCADSQSVAAISPWRFRAPLSAELAAEREGRTVPFDEVTAFCNEAAGRSRGICLIEGVGGVMSPIDQQYSNLDLMVALKARPLLVTGSYLGTISHTLTALLALERYRLEPAAVVISESETSPVDLADLAARLEAGTTAPIMSIGRNQDVPEALVELILRSNA
jgi:dethiobiotin synthetase